jgi:hypothetical protein
VRQDDVDVVCFVNFFDIWRMAADSATVVTSFKDYSPDEDFKTYLETS